MKKFFAVLLAVVFLCGCELKTEQIPKKHSGVWLTYNEINSMLENGFEKQFGLFVENCKNLEINNLYVHVRAFGDALYKSVIFPQNEKSLNYDFDILKYIIDNCHENNILVHAWINPYRISNSSENVEEINPKSPAYVWLKDEIPENDKNVCILDGIYFNPAESEAQEIIIDGVREIIKEYDVDGIHFDDYFYPTQSAEFDKLSYEEYKNENTSPLNLEDWRRLNVDVLLSGVYNAIKHIKNEVVFSVSPAASIENNFEMLYADVRSWVDNGFVDVIIPQLYFGFDYPDENFKFNNLLKKWRNVAAYNPDIKLYIGLPVYKSKPTFEPDVAEWKQNDIIKRQVEIIYNTADVEGYVYFSYSSLFSDEKEFKTQRENLKNYLELRN